MADKINSELDGLANFKITSEGKPIGNDFGLLSFKISRDINKIGKALLVFEAGDMPEGLVSESDKPTFDVGKTIKIEAGYGSMLKPIFEGIVAYHSVDVAAENNTTLQIECRELPYKATQNPKFENFGGKGQKVKDDKIIKDVLSNYGLTLTVKEADIEHSQYRQEYKTDWDVALSRALANGLVAVVDGESVTFAPPITQKQEEELEYGTNIIEFNAKLNVVNLYKKVIVETVGSDKQQAIKAEAIVDYTQQPGSTEDKPLNENYLIRAPENTPKSVLEKIAKAKALQVSMAKIEGSCKFCGRAEIKIGKQIALKGFGKRFEGDAYISSLEHDFNEDGWTTSVKFGLSLEYLGAKMGKSVQLKAGSTPSINNHIATDNLGLQIAKVTKLIEDPDKMHQIQVKILDSSGKEKKLWARLSNFWGSNAYGAFFIPEVNDEVILGFFNNDSAHPVILGSLYSGALPPPNKLTEKNNIQSITTKSKMKLEFDDENKVVSIETPGKNILRISDKEKGIVLEDQNKNKIEMNNSGIVLESAKGITLKAKTNITLEAGTALEAKAKTDLKLEGLNVEGKAKAALKMKGTATAEFSASGNTTVKGAIVMIN